MKTYLALFFFALSFTCGAQTQKKSLMIGGSGGATFNKGYNIDFNPNLGYFVADNLAIGAGFPLGFSKTTGYYTFTSRSVGIEPFLRYYFKSEARLRVFLQGNGSLTSYRHKTKEAGIIDISDNTKNYGGGLGLAYFLSENIALEARGYYLMGDQAYSQVSNGYLQLPMRHHAGIHVGVQLFLPR